MPEKEFVSVSEKYDARTKREPATQADTGAFEPSALPNAGGDPLAAGPGKYVFSVFIEGLSKIDKQLVECTGLDSIIELIPQIDDSPTVQKLPGKAGFSEVTLKWKVSSDLDLHEWYRKTLRGDIQKLKILIKYYSVEDNFFAYWYLVDAWPCAYSGPVLYSPDRGDPIESISLVCKDIVRVQ
jgi:phage tail-like protein